MFKKKLFYFARNKLVYLFLTLFFVFLWFKLVDFSRVAEAIINVKWLFIILALILALTASFLGALRLKTLLSVISDIPVSYIWGLGYITSLISLLFPFYLGGLSFAYIIAKKTKSSYRKAFSLIFIDFFIGVFITFFLALLAIFYFSKKKLLVLTADAFSNLTFAFVFALALVVIAAVFLKPKLKLLNKLLARIKRSASLFDRNIVSKVVILTLVMFLLGTVSAYLYFLAFEMRPPIIDFLLASSLFGVLSMIPGAPTKIGQYETLGVLSLPYLLNLDKTTVFAMLLFTHLVSITSILALGFLSIHFLGFDAKIFSLLSRAKDEKT